MKNGGKTATCQVTDTLWALFNIEFQMCNIGFVSGFE